MENYLIFVFEDYYPSGGAYDLGHICNKEGLLDGIELALIGFHVAAPSGEVHIYDLLKKEIVFSESIEWAPDNWPPDQKKPTKQTCIERIKYELQKQMSAWH